MINALSRKFRSRLLIPKIVSDVIESSLTYLDRASLSDLYHLTRDLDKTNRDGVVIEAGCALGGSAIVLAAAKTTVRPLLVYDVFGMIPEPSALDGADVHRRFEIIKSGKSEGINNQQYYGYQDSLIETVRQNFGRLGYPVEGNNVHLIKGLFQDTLTVQEPVLLAHLDGDWYESILTCLERIEPRLATGSVLVIDDYHAWSGCRKAVDEYFADKRDHYLFEMWSRLHIVRK